MKALILLIVLTRNGAGDINASFVNTDTLEQCHQKKLMVESIFTASNIPVIEQGCFQSNLKFSGFGHATSSNKIRNFYLIKIDDELQVLKMPDWSTCMMQAKQGVETARLYCGSSVQSLKE